MPGDHVLYKVNLKNHGPAVASGMNIADKLPEGVEYVSAETRICQDGATSPCTGPVYATANYDAAAGTWTAMESGILDTNLNVGGTETLYVLVKVKRWCNHHEHRDPGRVRPDRLQQEEQHLERDLHGRRHDRRHHLQRCRRLVDLRSW